MAELQTKNATQPVQDESSETQPLKTDSDQKNDIENSNNKDMSETSDQH